MLPFAGGSDGPDIESDIVSVSLAGNPVVEEVSHGGDGGHWASMMDCVVVMVVAMVTGVVTSVPEYVAISLAHSTNMSQHKT